MRIPFRVATSAILLLLLLCMFLAIQQRAVATDTAKPRVLEADTVRASSYLLVDSSGKQRGAIMADGDGASIMLGDVDAQNPRLILVTLNRDMAMVSLDDQNSGASVSLHLFAEGGGIEIKDGKGKIVFRQGARLAGPGYRKLPQHTNGRR